VITVTLDGPEHAVALEVTLPNRPTSLTIQWSCPREATVDPVTQERMSATRTSQDLLDLLGNDRLTMTQWCKLAKDEIGIANSSFYGLLKQLQDLKRCKDRPWMVGGRNSRTYPSLPNPTAINNELEYTD
jgi:hypothetical protein